MKINWCKVLGHKWRFISYGEIIGIECTRRNCEESIYDIFKLIEVMETIKIQQKKINKLFRYYNGDNQKEEAAKIGDGTALYNIRKKFGISGSDK